MAPDSVHISASPLPGSAVTLMGAPGSFAERGMRVQSAPPLVVCSRMPARPRSAHHPRARCESTRAAAAASCWASADQRTKARTRLADHPALVAVEGDAVVAVVDALLVDALDVTGLPRLAAILRLQQRLLCAREEAVLGVRVREGNVQQHHARLYAKVHLRVRACWVFGRCTVGVRAADAQPADEPEDRQPAQGEAEIYAPVEFPCCAALI